MSNNENKSITPLRKYIAIGYAIIALLIGGIVFIYLHEWRELERIETESKEMNMLRQKVHNAYAQMLDRRHGGCSFIPRFFSIGISKSRQAYSSYLHRIRKSDETEIKKKE